MPLTYHDSISFRKGAALGAVALLHMLVACALYVGLAQSIIRHFSPPPIQLQTLFKPPEKVTLRTDALRFDPWKLQIEAPENPSLPLDPQAGVTVGEDRATLGSGAPGADAVPVHEAVRIVGARVDPLHPLRIGAGYYPPAALRRGQEGRCVVQVTVAIDGRIIAATLHSGSGFPLLDDACLSAVRGQSMLPAMQDGKAIESTAMLPILWRMSAGGR